MNRITIAGHLGGDPEVRFTSSGQKVTTMRVAENQRKAGKDETLWWRVTLWDGQFDRIIPFLKKGSAVIVIGTMSKPTIFTNRDGQPQLSLDITAIDVTFSPFGKTEKEEKPSTPLMEEKSSHKEHENVPPRFGEGKEADLPAFSEDEIPF